MAQVKPYDFIIEFDSFTNTAVMKYGTFDALAKACQDHAIIRAAIIEIGTDTDINASCIVDAKFASYVAPEGDISAHINIQYGSGEFTLYE